MLVPPEAENPNSLIDFPEGIKSFQDVYEDGWLGTIETSHTVIPVGFNFVCTKYEITSRELFTALGKVKIIESWQDTYRSFMWDTQVNPNQAKFAYYEKPMLVIKALKLIAALDIVVSTKVRDKKPLIDVYKFVYLKPVLHQVTCQEKEWVRFLQAGYMDKLTKYFESLDTFSANRPAKKGTARASKKGSDQHRTPPDVLNDLAKGLRVCHGIARRIPEFLAVNGLDFAVDTVVRNGNGSLTGASLARVYHPRPVMLRDH
ncbi:MAG: hypothetical protein ACLPX9_02725 [Rhodomicrobium sp.]